MKTCPTCHASYADTVAFCARDGALLRSAAGLEPGTIIRKKYQVVSEIAHGGMGVVYRVRHLLWNEDRAIKLLLDAGPQRGQRSDGFLAEALVMRQLDHPNIVRIEDADFTEDDQLFVVMEYVEGESLAERMSGGPLPWEQALELIAQACAGLSAAHQKGIIHRDIKPQNLLVTKGADGREIVKVIDFGIARVREDAGIGLTGIASTESGVFMGTPEYASPEQAQGLRGSALDARTDIYSLGLVLYEMLTGAAPFVADTLIASLMLRLANEPRPPDLVRPDLQIPQTVSDLVMKAVARDREARFQSAERMRQAIAVALGRPAGTVEEVRPVAPPPARLQKRKKTAWGAPVLLLGAAVMAIAAWFFWSHTRPQSTPLTPDVRQAQVAEPGPGPDARKRAGQAAPPAPQETSPPTPAEEKKADEKKSKAAEVVNDPLEKPPSPPAPAAQNNMPKLKINPQDGLEYLWIPPGSFTMGCSPGDTTCAADESPAHQVTIAKGFWIAKTEVTQAAYERVIGRNPSDFKGSDLPVESVSWLQANAFCKAAGMRLPSEAEWEYAARGGSSGSRYGGLSEIAWWLGNGESKTHAAAQKQPNPYGLFDMLGNVAEWTADRYGPYSADAATDPHGPPEGQYRVWRGGSWYAPAIAVRASKRAAHLPAARGSFIGMRCAGD